MPDILRTQHKPLPPADPAALLAPDGKILIEAAIKIIQSRGITNHIKVAEALARSFQLSYTDITAACRHHNLLDV